MNNFDIELIKKYVHLEKQEEALNKLKTGYPVQYIIGNVEFYGNIIDVNENVLIPRFETEYLVDDLLKIIKEKAISNPKILEIGTGSGCISIALKKNLLCDITAIDISNDAVALARKNAKNCDANINFIVQDMHDLDEGDYDILVSNPPYVPYGSSVNNIEYEPQNAIYADDNGLYFYKVILEKSTNLLKKKFIIAFEIGDGEGDAIKELALHYYPEANVLVKKDLNYLERYVYIVNW